MNISPDEFEKLFSEFRREAFRLETLDDYTGSSSAEMFRVFMAGDPQPDDYNQEWVDEVRANIDAGKRMYRVHVLARPLTDYLRFELGWGYRKSIGAGEEFFILDITDGVNPLEDVPDFWMFDESTVVSMDYGAGGTFLGAESHSDMAPWLKRRDVALSRAVPFADWWERHSEE
ncbi:DUF6879 family protein [Streptomyces sp. SAJ15]|uniref:DUF6879 family protein n=1 Tax=Streptomyces sp. SAJ15 TaxID=2011095 RepID=UPI001184C78D|nr:DUF6879 family protein [Streptomyces sp. SAJ15]TVL91745.1 hypothetical protein CD790_13615 [Streptomyces sp. SAJ15]